MNHKILTWTPRVLAILAILFMMMFSMDCFGEYTRLDKQLICFVMHNINAFILILVLYLAWKKPISGGLAFIGMSLVMSLQFGALNGNYAVLLICSPFLLAGILFVTDGVKSRRNATTG